MEESGAAPDTGSFATAGRPLRAPSRLPRLGRPRPSRPRPARPSAGPPRPVGAGPAARRPLWRRLPAWMLVLPVDAVMVLSPALWAPQYAKAFVATAALAVLLLSGGGRYRARLHLSVLDELPVLVGRLLVAAALVALVFALRHDGVGVIAFLDTVLWSLALVVAGRLVTTRVVLTARRRGLVVHRAVLVGGGELAAELAGTLERHPRYGLSVVGFVDDSTVCPAGRVARHLGPLENLDRVVVSADAGVVLVAADVDDTDLLRRVRTPVCLRRDLLVVPRLHALETGHADHIGSIPVHRVRTPSLSGPAWALKRAFDLTVALAALLCLLPVMAACAIAVRVEGGAGVIFRQARVGRDGRLFDCLKFRSMVPTGDAEAATRWSVLGDRRIGPVGRVLRRTSLDELPQLWNIVRGEMTLVGPRPERPHFVEKFSAEHAHYDGRHRVPSGLTGLAQVSGLRGADSRISERARVDNYYIENWSLWLDAKVLLRTVVEVVLARGR